MGAVQEAFLPQTDAGKLWVLFRAFPLPDTQTDAGKFWELFRISLFQSHRQMQGNCGCCSGFPSPRHRQMQGNCGCCSGFPSLTHRQMQGNCGCCLGLSLFQIQRHMQGNCGCCSGFPAPSHTDICREILTVEAFPSPDKTNAWKFWVLFRLSLPQTDAGKLWVLFRFSLSQTHRQMQGNCGCCSSFPSPRYTDRCREIVGAVQAFPSPDRCREIVGVV